MTVHTMWKSVQSYEHLLPWRSSRKAYATATNGGVSVRFAESNAYKTVRQDSQRVALPSEVR